MQGLYFTIYYDGTPVWVGVGPGVRDRGLVARDTRTGADHLGLRRAQHDIRVRGGIPLSEIGRRQHERQQRHRPERDLDRAPALLRHEVLRRVGQRNGILR
jgi:hypothetical protein